MKIGYSMLYTNLKYATRLSLIFLLLFGTAAAAVAKSNEANFAPASIPELMQSGSQYASQSSAEWTQSFNFQSTSTMQGSGSQYASQPYDVDYNGIVEYDAIAPNRGRRGIGISTPDEDDDDDKPIDSVPLGEPLVPMIFFALIYAAYIVLRKRKTIE